MGEPKTIDVGYERPKKPSEPVHKRLQHCISLFEERNRGEYKNVYKQFGEVAKIIFPDGLQLRKTRDFNRYFSFSMILCKILRYSKNFKFGGHPDSLIDISVYAQMLAELDDE